MIDASVLDELTDTAAQALQAWSSDRPMPAPAASAAIALLLARYAATGRDDLGDVAGLALARAMSEAAVATDRDDRSAWLGVFLDARACSADDRLRAASDVLAGALVREWPAAGPVESLTRAVEMVLLAGHREPDTGGRIAVAVDELERIIGLVYTPGRGIAHAVGESSSDREGTLGDHVRAASALLTAHAVTGRLPYGMLAEELVQFARRQCQWDGDCVSSEESFVTQCEAARVLCRLAALHADGDYRAAAIIGSVDYAADGERALSALAPACGEQSDRAAACGLALLELFALSNLK